ncbi:MAG: hypothetical protein V2A34_15025 [Lentisphaerota bacterium]
MRKQICWKEKMERGVTREIRVSFFGAGQLEWQFKRSDQDEWYYRPQPEEGHWKILLDKLENLYSRGRIPYKKLEMVRELVSKASGEKEQP